MKKTEFDKQRRQLVKTAGAGLVLAPVLTITGCSEDKPAAAAQVAEDKAAAMGDDAAKVTETAVDTAADATQEAVDAASDAAETVVEATEEVADEVTDVAEEAVESVTSDAGAAPRVDEGEALAKSLGYKHDTADVDTEKYPQFQPGQNCANCILYQGGDAAWGACSIFVGKAVNAKGWCATYAARG